MNASDPFIIAGVTLGSRLFLGTAGYPNQRVMLQALAASGAELVTASIRRIDLSGASETLLDALGGRYRFLPNTAGCATVKDAVLTAELGREALETDWVKLELIGDAETLYPDVEQLVRAAAELVRARECICRRPSLSCQNSVAGTDKVNKAKLVRLGRRLRRDLSVRRTHELELVRIVGK